jgi:hypothetical protein
MSQLSPASFQVGECNSGEQGAWNLLGRRVSLAVFVITLLGLAVCQSPTYGQANVTGQWQTINTQAPINPVHISLMHNGKVLVVSGSGNLPSDTSYMAGVFDPIAQTFTTQPLLWDMFCNGMTELPDGRPFITGGTIQYDPFYGQPRASTYDPATGSFVDMQPMAHGRWYPTNTTLGNGSVMVFSGLDENGNTNKTVEIYTVGQGWSTPYTASWTPPLYPRMHLLPSGNVFYSGSTPTSSMFNPTTHAWTVGVATTNYSGTRTYGSSVLLPLTPANNYKPVVMIFGGGSPATATTELIDLSVASPSWVYGPPMSQPRIEMDATLLPNGMVLAAGGSLNDEDTTTASLNADLYNPTTNTFSSAGQNAFARLYHSNLILLPDATLLFVGGNPARGTYEPHIEIYSPPYLFNADGSLATRPTITSVSQTVLGWNSGFQVVTPNASNISSVVLMRAGSVTHAFDMDQRMVGLNYTVGSGVLNVTTPPNGNIAPPGYYLLFILNSSGVPSVAQFVQISTAPSDVPPTATITSPSADESVAAGATVSFSGTGTSSTGSISSYSWVFPGGTPSTSTSQNPVVTFPTTGVYTVSLTVTDNQGITSPSPATRVIAVGESLPDFAVSILPATESVWQGLSGAFTVSTTGLSGFGNPITLSASGMPAGTTATFNPSVVTPGSTSTLTLATSSSTPIGSSSTITVLGTSGSHSHSATATFNVTTPGTSSGNTISVKFVGNGTAMASTETAGMVPKAYWNQAPGNASTSPLALVDETGSSSGATITWSSDNVWNLPIVDQPGNYRMMRGYLDTGFGNTSTVTVSGLPANGNGYNVWVYADGDNGSASKSATYQITVPGSTTSVNLTDTPNTNFSGTFTQANNSAGNYVVFTISATSFTLYAIPSTASNGYPRAPVNGIQIVPIGGGSTSDFSISTSPATLTVTQGSSAVYTTSVTAIGAFSSSVALSASGLPAGTTATFNPPSISAGTSSTLTITTSSTTPTNVPSTLTITGTSGTLSHSGNVSLTVNGVADFSVSASPSTNTVVPGNSAVYTVSTSSLNGFTSIVNLSASGAPGGTTVTMNPTSVTVGNTATLTIATTASTPLGTSTITITGTSGQLTHSTTVTLTVSSTTYTPKTVSVKFVGIGTAMAATESAGVVTKTNWNQASGAASTSALALLDETGTASGASVTWRADNVWNTPIADAAGNYRMMRGYLDTGFGNTTTVTVSNLPASVNGYTVYVYADADNGGASKTGTYQIAGSGITTTGIELTDAANTNFSGTFVQANNSAGNYVVFTINSGVSSFTLSAIPTSASDGTLRAPLNAIEIVPITQVTPDFTLATTPSTYTVVQGGNAIYTSSVTAVGGFTGSVALSVTGLPTGTTATFNPASISSGGSSTLTITTSSTTPANVTSTLTITGTSGALSHSNTVTMTVTGSPDFSLSATPSTNSVGQGSSAIYTASATALSGFTGTVSLSASGLPSGVTATFNPTSITPGNTSALTIATTSTTPLGTSTITITGTSGALTHTTSVSLAVTTAGAAVKPISIKFVGNGTPMASTESAGVVAETNWNQASGNISASSLALVDASGNGTGASITWTADNVWNTPIADTPGNYRMMRGYLDTGFGNTTTAIVSGLPSAPNGYTVYIYADADNGSTTKTATYQIAGTGITTTSITLTDAANTNFSGTFTQANNGKGNYVVFTIASGVSGFTISAIPTSASDGNLRAPLNSIQIVPR